MSDFEFAQPRYDHQPEAPRAVVVTTARGKEETVLVPEFTLLA
jgi:hypothetical protein